MRDLAAALKDAKKRADASAGSGPSILGDGGSGRGAAGGGGGGGSGGVTGGEGSGGDRRGSGSPPPDAGSWEAMAEHRRLLSQSYQATGEAKLSGVRVG